MSDPFNLQRFVIAQERMYEWVLRELRAGQKASHWMWFIFPQIAGLGRSGTAEHYAITSIDEARAYLAHDVLGERLRECTRLALAVENRSAERIFGFPDVLKFRSCMTLFDQATDETLFGEALAKYYDGPDQATLEILAAQAG